MSFRNNEILAAQLGIEQKARMMMEFLQIKLPEYEWLRVAIPELKRETEQKELVGERV